MKLFVLSLLCIALALSGAQGRAPPTTILPPRTADAVGAEAERLFNQQYQLPPFQRHYKRVNVHNATREVRRPHYWVKMTMGPTLCQKVMFDAVCCSPRVVLYTDMAGPGFGNCEKWAERPFLEQCLGSP
ncbi:unnamed protein product [Bursaphelenchus xylophilus]|uniref:(pine wood nematode) hypothetical protein n=1 Tax=Bursaphelenchus xylophilus TaxID=6326 RepID=A0A7I8WLR4_BURXY|nr:unnamed protein product [Bursaphelenchus xylophilus]CAG9105279.1 unnamed protein product [Bursaphelenchus xylophilus]